MVRRIEAPKAPSVLPPVASLRLKIEMRALADLRSDPRNARKHEEKQIAQIAESIRRFGFNNPILVDRDGLIIAGHGRFAASRLLGLEAVPTLCLGHLSETEQRAYRIADNRLAELSSWDQGLLAIELGELRDLDFEMELTGFRPATERGPTSIRLAAPTARPRGSSATVVASSCGSVRSDSRAKACARVDLHAFARRKLS